MTGVIGADTAGPRPVRVAGPRPLQVAVCSRAGLRSGVWSVVPVRDTERAVAVGPERGAATATASAPRPRCAGWEVRIPPDTAAQRGLDPARCGPAACRPVLAPASGWTVGLVLLVPLFALTLTAPPTRSRARVLHEPAPGRCVQVMVALGEPDAEPLVLPPALDAGSLTGRDGTRIQLWSGQTTLAPELTRHLVRLRRELAATAPAEPGRTAAFARLGGDAGVDVVADLGTL
ncbi:hypothetical protein [Pseudonocardia sp. KRD291]|uniref:hypothetical protein n=1 Tax=Pseudonocardia sp. KRD291 TaxID=2792007 RepID=UPI001C4A3C15|nr:hypothetical protein [Pseudonocardia sp. KRD291]MBW0101344.1 hypothetical protein [Pseudonocardia sp. KRD291]